MFGIQEYRFWGNKLYYRIICTFKYYFLIISLLILTSCFNEESSKKNIKNKNNDSTFHTGKTINETENIGGISFNVSRIKSDDLWNYNIKINYPNFNPIEITLNEMESNYYLNCEDFTGDSYKDLIFYTISGSGSIPYYVMFEFNNGEYIKVFEGEQIYSQKTDELLYKFDTLKVKNKFIYIHESIYAKDGLDPNCCPSGGKRIRKFKFNSSSSEFDLLN